MEPFTLLLCLNSYSLPLQRAAFCSTSNRLSVHFINHVVIDSILRSEHNFLAGKWFHLILKGSNFLMFGVFSYISNATFRYSQKRWLPCTFGRFEHYNLVWNTSPSISVAQWLVAFLRSEHSFHVGQALPSCSESCALPLPSAFLALFCLQPKRPAVIFPIGCVLNLGRDVSFRTSAT